MTQELIGPIGIFNRENAIAVLGICISVVRPFSLLYRLLVAVRPFSLLNGLLVVVRPLSLLFFLLVCCTGFWLLLVICVQVLKANNKIVVGQFGALN